MRTAASHRKHACRLYDKQTVRVERELPGAFDPSLVPRSQRRVTRREALGHNSKAVHRAYAKRALMKMPSLEDYEERAKTKAEQAA
jgi:hypothetical protein